MKKEEPIGPGPSGDKNDPIPTKKTITVDLTARPALFEKIAILADDKERAIESQIIYIVKQFFSKQLAINSYVIDTKNLSDTAKMVLSELDDEKISQIRRDNPFKEDRNNAIRELCKRGVENNVLAEITGLSNQAISDIKLSPSG